MCKEIPGAERNDENGLRSNWKNLVNAIGYFVGAEVSLPAGDLSTEAAAQFLTEIASKGRADIKFSFSVEGTPGLKCVKCVLSKDGVEPFSFYIRVSADHAALVGCNNFLLGNFDNSFIYRLLNPVSEAELALEAFLMPKVSGFFGLFLKIMEKLPVCWKISISPDIFGSDEI